MAKKSSSGFNMSEEIRTLLKENANMTGRDAINAIKAKYPKATINENSCQVAFANARKKMGLTKTMKRRPRKAAAAAKKAWRPKVAAASTSASSGGLDISRLKAAKDLLSFCGGDAAAAAEAIRQLASLQMN